jgi:cytidylate kinase
MNIALDGPAGSGKSTVAKALAASYNMLYLDTGAMYRACALYFYRNGVSPEDTEGVEKALKNLDLSVKYVDGTQRTYLGDEDVSEAIRKNEISMLASKVATNGAVRKKMVEKQQEIASRQSCVLDGRDIGTVVLPNTPYKFYVTAAARVRAERRLKELREKGNTEITLPALLEEIEKRDEQDMNRKFSPLRKAEDATLIDTTFLTVDEAVTAIRNKIQEKV